MPANKIIINYKKVKSNDIVCIFANVGVPTSYCRKPSVPLIWDCNNELCKSSLSNVKKLELIYSSIRQECIL